MSAGEEPVAGSSVEKTTGSYTPSPLGNGSTSLKIQIMAVVLVGVVLVAEILGEELGAWLPPWLCGVWWGTEGCLSTG